MRELFDEVAGQSRLDPEEAVRRTTRGPRRKRFYTKAGVVEGPGGFAITLDDKPVRTPSGRALTAPTREIADAIAAEWEAQPEFIDPLTMPVTRFANSVVDAVVDRVEAVTDDVAKYLGTDLLFYRAGHPEALVAREAAHWDPVVFWAAETLGAHFMLAEGIVHVRQPEAGGRGGARGTARRSLVDRGHACGDDHDGLGAARAGAAARRARCRSGLERCPCRRGLEYRAMGSG